VGKSIGYSAALLIAAGLAAPAAAQEAAPWRTRVTVGAQVKPQYPGAEDVSIQPLIDIDRARGDTPFEFEAADDSFGVTLLRSHGFSVGPVIALVGSRKPEDVGAAVPKVDRTVELGAFAHAWVGDNLRLSAEVRRGVNGHDGWIGVGGADVVLREGDKWLFSLGPRVTWADNNFQDAYFSVTPPTASGTGLPVYDAGSGIEAVGASATAVFQFGPRWGLSMYGKYDRLTGDAANSPIVRTYGSRDQFSAGAGISYSF
jgi:outer membrane protein